LTETTQINKLLNNSLKNGEDVLDALESFISVYKEQKQKENVPAMPLLILSNRKLGILEIVVKFMKENLTLSFSEISSIIKRDQRTIWTTYHKAISKHEEQFSVKKEKYFIPFEIFSDRKKGPLEAVVCHLKDVQKLSFKQIAEILNRDYNTIWLSYKNGKKHDK